MADQEVQNGGAEKVTTTETKTALTFELIPVLGVKAPKADEAAQFYKKLFGAVEIRRDSTSKRKADQEEPLLQVLLQIGSAKLVVADRLEDELKGEQNSTLQLVAEEDVKDLHRELVAAGGITEHVGSSDYLFAGKNYIGKVRDPFGVVWIIASNKTFSFLNKPVSNVSPTVGNNTSAAESGPNSTAEVEA